MRNGKVMVHMLYDHKTDPMGNLNIADKPKLAPIVKRLQKLLADEWNSLPLN